MKPSRTRFSPSDTGHPCARVNVKIRRGGDRHELVRALKSAPGVRSVVQTFPDEKDPDLANLYLLEIDAPDLRSALARLRGMQQIEYAEQTAPRKLIR